MVVLGVAAPVVQVGEVPVVDVEVPVVVASEVPVLRSVLLVASVLAPCVLASGSCRRSFLVFP